jgi:hypothetical protein
LDRYLHAQARQDADRRVAAVFVLVPVSGSAVIGYYTLSATSVAINGHRISPARPIIVTVSHKASGHRAPRLHSGAKISPRFHRVEGIRRNDFMPESMIRTTLPLTPPSVPLCPLPSPHDQWHTCGKHSGGPWELLAIMVQ